jgi:protein-tyrosine kinase
MPDSGENHSHMTAPASAFIPNDGWKERLRTVTAEPPAGSPVFPFDGRDSRASEQYRIIRTKLLHHTKPLHLVAISSPQLGDGKSVTTANIAGALALKNEMSVLLIDADLRRSALAALFGVAPTPGLTEVLSGECTLDQAVIHLNVGGIQLYFLPAGRKRNNPAEMLASTSWTAFCEEVRRRFDCCILDTPPIGVVTDYELIQTAADGILMVVRPDHTTRKHCLEALQSIPKEKLVGLVANCVPEWFLTNRNKHEYLYYRGPDD